MKKHYLLIIALFLYNVGISQTSEILYFDLDPDSMRTFRNWETPDPPIILDVNRNDTCEWKFQSWDEGWQAISLRIQPNVSNWLVDSVCHYDFYKKLRLRICQVGDTLSNQSWGSVPELTVRELGDYPDQMLGLRYLVEGGFCYGWIHFSFRLYEPAPIIWASRLDVTIHEMAYCTIPNYPLRAGQTSFNWEGVDEKNATAIASIQPNPTNGLVSVFGKDLESAEVFNALGQFIVSSQGSGSQLVVNLSSQPAGIYFVNVTDSEGRKCVKKVIKQ